jgi:hypothetical protein
LSVAATEGQKLVLSNEVAQLPPTPMWSIRSVDAAAPITMLRWLLLNARVPASDVGWYIDSRFHWL